MYVCVCKAVTDQQIRTAIEQGLCSRKQLFQCFGVGADCGKCNPHVKEMLKASQQFHTIAPGASNDAYLTHST